MSDVLMEKLKVNLLRLEKAEMELKEETNSLEKNIQKWDDLNKIQLFFQTTAEAVQSKIKAKMESVVQAALDICFPSQFKFNFQFVPCRGKVEVHISITENGFEIAPQDACGGSLTDIISFGLRLAVWSLGSSDGVILMDEPFKFLDTQRQETITKLLKELSKQLKVQLIIISHRKEVQEAADKLFIVEKTNNISHVKEYNNG